MSWQHTDCLNQMEPAHPCFFSIQLVLNQLKHFCPLRIRVEPAQWTGRRGKRRRGRGGGGKGAFPDFRKIEFPDLLELTWGKSRFQKKINFRNCWGWRGARPDFRKKRISKSVSAEIGPVCVAEKIHFQICFDWNGAHRMLGKIEFPDLFWWKLGTPDVGKNWNSRSVWMEMGHTGCREKLNWISRFNLFLFLFWWKSRNCEPHWNSADHSN